MHHAHIDKFAYQDSPVHRLDSRVKLVSVLAFTVLVISLPRYAISVLACYAIVPFAMLALAQIPLKFVAKHLLIVCPFVLVLALSCPLYNHTTTAFYFGPWKIDMTLGWMQFANIMGKFIVTMSALMALVCTTKFSDLLAGMQRMKMPAILVSQLGFLYRYIFLLIDKAHHILQARTARTLRYLGAKQESKIAGAMVGSLLLQSLEVSERINIAMQARGFSGSFRTINRLKIVTADYVFMFVYTAALVILHAFIRPAMMG